MRHTKTKYRRNIGRVIRHGQITEGRLAKLSIYAVVAAAADRRLLGKPLRVACQKYRKARVLLRVCAEAIPLPSIPSYMG
jgi:hypothetical protein